MTTIRNMKTGALTGLDAASQNKGLMSSRRRRSAARFAEWLRLEPRQNQGWYHARSRFGLSRHVRASSSVVSANPTSDMPETTPAECQKLLGPRRRVLISADMSVWIGLKAASQFASGLVGP